MYESTLAAVTISICLVSLFGAAVQRISERSQSSGKSVLFFFVCLTLASAFALLAFANGLRPCWPVACAIPLMAITMTLDLRGSVQSDAF